jgi:hypothetical protein
MEQAKKGSRGKVKALRFRMVTVKSIDITPKFKEMLKKNNKLFKELAK